MSADGDEDMPKNLFGSDDEEEEERQGQDREEATTQRTVEPAASLGGAADGKEEGEDDAGEEGPAPSLEAARGRTQSSSGSDDEDPRDRQQDRYAKPVRPVAPPMAIEAPLLPLPPADKLHLIRTSNIVGIEPTPFDPATYQLENDLTPDDALNTGSARGAANAKLRWRVRRLADGREVQESNARFVRWSDGSLQLLLGNEVLDVKQQDVRSNNMYLFVVRGILQGQAQLTSRLALRPASLDSGLHRRLRDMVDKRHKQSVKVARHGGLQNPEVEKARREAAEEERIKSKCVWGT